MGSTTEFPRIKEVRTFIIDGVGSGGDYHNVRICFIRPSN
jgi:L-rhamnonate dehydratase